MSVMSTMPTSVKEFFGKVHLRPDVVQRVGVCQYNIAGPGGGMFYLAHDGSTLDLREGSHPSPTVTVEIAIKQFLDCCFGMVDMRELLAKGLLQVKGDAFLAAEFHNRLMAMPHPDIVTTFDVAAEKVGRRPPLREVAREAFPAERAVAEALAESRPLILTDAASKLMVNPWTLDYLTRAFGDVPVLVRESVTTMTEFVEQLRRTPTEGVQVPYAFGPALPQKMHDDIKPPVYVKDDYVAFLWMGGAGSVTPLHRDFNDGFLLQVFGRKKIWLYSPDQAPWLYAAPAFGRFQQCAANPEAPDLDKHPLFANARPIEIVLSPGEMLALPAGWFHHIRTLDTGASVRYEATGYDLDYYHRRA